MPEYVFNTRTEHTQIDMWCSDGAATSFATWDASLCFNIRDCNNQVSGSTSAADGGKIVCKQIGDTLITAYDEDTGVYATTLLTDVLISRAFPFHIFWNYRFRQRHLVLQEKRLMGVQPRWRIHHECFAAPAQRFVIEKLRLYAVLDRPSAPSTHQQLAAPTDGTARPQHGHHRRWLCKREHSPARAFSSRLRHATCRKHLQSTTQQGSKARRERPAIRHQNQDSHPS